MVASDRFDDRLGAASLHLADVNELLSEPLLHSFPSGLSRISMVFGSYNARNISGPKSRRSFSTDRCFTVVANPCSTVINGGT